MAKKSVMAVNLNAANENGVISCGQLAKTMAENENQYSWRNVEMKASVMKLAENMAG
jgi:hypothetical protein